MSVEKEHYDDSVLYHDKEYLVKCPNDHICYYICTKDLPEKLEFKCKACNILFSLEDVVKDMIFNEEIMTEHKIDTIQSIVAIKMKKHYKIIFDSLTHKKYGLMYLIFSLITDKLKIDKSLLNSFEIEIPKKPEGLILLILEYIDSFAFFFCHKKVFEE